MSYEPSQAISSTGFPLPKLPLSWRARDIERKLLFPAAPFTQANTFLSLLLGLLGCALTYGILIFFPNLIPKANDILMHRGWTQYAVAVIFFWGAAILLIKWRKLAVQKRALQIQIVPDDASFVLSPLTADDVLATLLSKVDDPEAFVLFNRIRRALMGLKNMGRVSDVDTVIQAQADGDANFIDSSYSLLKAFCWAMPVLGFIGTVVGLSRAVGGFGSVLASEAGTSVLKERLQGVTRDLSVAFDATLLSLSATLVLHMLLSLLRKKEDDFLVACDDYCHRSIISKLRLLAHPERE